MKTPLRSWRALRTVAAVVVPLAGLMAFSVPSQADVTNCAASSPTGAYTVKVCITAPAPGAVLSGNVPVTGTITVTGTSPGVAKSLWTVNGGFLLTDYASPHAFTLYTDDFADGAYTIAMVAKLRDGETSAPASVTLTFNNGNATTPVNPNSWVPPAPVTNPWGTPMTVAAAGDGAGGEANTTAVINTVNGWNPDLFLYLGDVYEDGTLTEFRNWYGTGGSWFDLFRSITLPVIGNHEYDGGGYWSYWDNIPHYYSVDSNGWHFVAIDSTAQYNQTAPGTAQYDWLQQDLANNTSPCTVVFAHHPLYNIGKEGPSTRLTDMWQLMADEKVTMFLVGHDHTYQRWVPLNRNGVANPNGVTEIVAGTGGHSSQAPMTSDPRVVTKLKGFGAFRMNVTGSGMNYKFVTSTGATADQGSLSCKGDDGIAPTAPSGLSGTATPTGVFLNWGAASDNFGVTSYSVYRDDVLIGTATGTTYQDTTAPGASHVVYRVAARDAAGNETLSAGAPVDTGGSDNAAPTVPTGLTAALDNGTRLVTLDWADSTDNVGVDHYTVYRDDVAVGTPATSGFSETLPTGLDSASYTVSASDVAGNESAQSAAALVTTVDTTPPGPPPALAGTATGPNTAQLTWGAASDNVAVTGYRVYRDGAQAAVLGAGTLTYTDRAVMSQSTHTYAVRAEDAQGNLSTPASVSVTQPVATGPLPVHDSWVNAASPTATAGTSTLMRSDADPVQRPYLRFDLSGVQGQVVRARLLVYANTRSTTAVSVRSTSTAWLESTLNWNNAPAPGAVVASIPAWGAAQWITVDVTSAVTAGQQVGFVLDTASSTSATYASKESASAPVLLLDVFE